MNLNFFQLYVKCCYVMIPTKIVIKNAIVV